MRRPIPRALTCASPQVRIELLHAYVARRGGLQKTQVIEFARAHKCFALLALVMMMSSELGAAGDGGVEQPRDKNFEDDVKSRTEQLGNLLDVENERLEGAARRRLMISLLLPDLDTDAAAESVQVGGVDARIVPLTDSMFGCRA